MFLAEAWRLFDMHIFVVRLDLVIGMGLGYRSASWEVYVSGEGQRHSLGETLKNIK